MPLRRTLNATVLRCPHCRLVQYCTANGLCRRCRRILQPTPRMPTYARNIGRGIRMLRQEHGLTQSQLAASLNTRRTYISTIERGVAIPSILTIERIAAIFDLDIAGVFLLLRRMQRISDRAQTKTL